MDNAETVYEFDLHEMMRIRALETGTIQDEAVDFLLSQKGRIPRIAADIGVSQNTLYDVVAGRRATLKCVVAEKILRYKVLLGESLLSCQLKTLQPKT